MDRGSGDFKEKCQQPKLSHSRVRERTKEMMTGEGGEPPPSFIGGVAPREQQATQVPRTGQARGSHSARSAQLGAPHTSHMWRESERGLVCVVSLSAPPYLPEKSRPDAPQSVGCLFLSAAAATTTRTAGYPQTI